MVGEVSASHLRTGESQKLLSRGPGVRSAFESDVKTRYSNRLFALHAGDNRHLSVAPCG